MRIHFNFQDEDIIDKLPFKSWQCITLSLKNRDVDIVIPCEKDQNLLVKFLLFKMKTADGIKNSGIEPVEKILKL